MAPAPFINQFPECPVKNCLANPGDLGKCHVQVVEREQAFAVRRSAEFFTGVRRQTVQAQGDLRSSSILKLP